MDTFDIIQSMGRLAFRSMPAAFVGAFLGCVVALAFKPVRTHTTFRWQIGTSFLAALLASVLSVVVFVVLVRFGIEARAASIGGSVPIIIGALIGVAYTNTRLRKKVPPASASQSH